MKAAAGAHLPLDSVARACGAQERKRRKKLDAAKEKRAGNYKF